MSDVFDSSKIKVSDCPTDFIPAGAKIIIGVDMAKDGDFTVRGFYDLATGEYHIQEVVHNAALRSGEAVPLESTVMQKEVEE